MGAEGSWPVGIGMEVATQSSNTSRPLYVAVLCHQRTELVAQQSLHISMLIPGGQGPQAEAQEPVGPSCVSVVCVGDGGGPAMSRADIGSVPTLGATESLHQGCRYPTGEPQSSQQFLSGLFSKATLSDATAKRSSSLHHVFTGSLTVCVSLHSMNCPKTFCLPCGSE